MTFKVGEYVKLRDDLLVGEQYGKHIFGSPMQIHLGKLKKIVTIDSKGSIYLDGSGFLYSQEMLESLEEQTNEKLNEEIKYGITKMEFINQLREIKSTILKAKDILSEENDLSQDDIEKHGLVVHTLNEVIILAYLLKDDSND